MAAPAKEETRVDSSYRTNDRNSERARLAVQVHLRPLIQQVTGGIPENLNPLNPQIYGNTCISPVPPVYPMALGVATEGC